MITGANTPPPSMNAIIAGAAGYANQVNGSQSLRQADSSIRADAARAAAQAGAGANTSVQYNYEVGPDGQLYATSATITTSKRTQGPRDPLSGIQGSDGIATQPLAQQAQQRPQSLADYARPGPTLSAADEAAIFGSEDFLNDVLNSNEAQRRARLQLADFGVRAQEGQHFRAAAGLGSLPQYDYEVGPDGEVYAVAGSVGISSGPASSEEEAAADAATIARAALAATDVSAQDISVARDAQSRAASLYASNYNIAEQETPLFQFAA